MAILGRRPRRLALVCGCLLLGTGRGSAQARFDRAEYEVKSAYLLTFLRFVEWPDEPGRGRDVTLCVLGDDPMGDLLSRAIAARRVEGRVVTLRAVSRLVEADRCDAAFIARRNSIAPTAWLARLRGKPVLTVGEGTEFARAGGMIALVLDGETVRFEINLRALHDAGFELSSRVLRLAVNVHE